MLVKYVNEYKNNLEFFFFADYDQNMKATNWIYRINDDMIFLWLTLFVDISPKSINPPTMSYCLIIIIIII